MEPFVVLLQLLSVNVTLSYGPVPALLNIPFSDAYPCLPLLFFIPLPCWDLKLNADTARFS